VITLARMTQRVAGDATSARRHAKNKKASDSDAELFSEGSPAAQGWRMPAEWEPRAATWLAFPHKSGDWPGKSDAVLWVFAEVIRHLSRGERIRMLVGNAKQAGVARNAIARVGADIAQVDFIACATNRSWTRDYLPNFLVKSAGSARGKPRLLGAVKWRFTGWHRYPDHKLDDAAGLFVAEKYADMAYYPTASARGRTFRVTLEGGSIDVDGEGTLLTTEACLLVGRRARHAQLDRQASERLLRDHLGVKRVIWLHDGIAGDDTSGHIDDLARFVKPGVVVLCSETNRRDANYRVLAQAKERLSGERDAAGRRLQVVLLPMPEPVVDRGTRLPASYANFYIGAECVLVPTFNDVSDSRALGILSELFPERRVIGIHASELVLGLGTLHCSTQQEPRP